MPNPSPTVRVAIVQVYDVPLHMERMEKHEDYFEKEPTWEEFVTWSIEGLFVDGLKQFRKDYVHNGEFGVQEVSTIIRVIFHEDGPESGPYKEKDIRW